MPWYDYFYFAYLKPISTTLFSVLVFSLIPVLLFLLLRWIRKSKTYDLLKTVALSLLTLLFLVATAIAGFFSIYLIDHSIRYCPRLSKQFSYDGCSVTYEEPVQRGSCTKCSIHPCIYGLENNKRIDIANCLCKSGKTDKAGEFIEKYIPILKNDSDSPCEKEYEHSIYY